VDTTPSMRALFYAIHLDGGILSEATARKDATPSKESLARRRVSWMEHKSFSKTIFIIQYSIFIFILTPLAASTYYDCFLQSRLGFLITTYLTLKV
jgi:hypothetical protein